MKVRELIAALERAAAEAPNGVETEVLVDVNGGEILLRIADPVETEEEVVDFDDEILHEGITEAVVITTEDQS